MSGFAFDFFLGRGFTPHCTRWVPKSLLMNFQLDFLRDHHHRCGVVDFIKTGTSKTGHS